MLIVDVVSRVIHVATAITLVGGSVFLLLVLMPVAQRLEDAPHQQLRDGVGAIWKRFVHSGITLFLITGLYNYIRAIPHHRDDGLYHALLGTKMLLAVVVFFVAAALVGRSEKLKPIRQSRRKWLTLTVLLAAVIVAISGYVKVRGIPM